MNNNHNKNNKDLGPPNKHPVGLICLSEEEQDMQRGGGVGVTRVPSR